MNIAIYCGSSFGNDPIFESHAKNMIQALYKKDATIVYGGSKAGIMGTISKEAISLNMKVLGVITHKLIDKEILNPNITKIYTVSNIRERKAKMEELSDAFIGFPGGFGTIEELSEVFTSIQIGIHKKPCALYNLNGYYDKLVEFFQSCVDQGFIKQSHLDAIIVSDDIEYIYNSFVNYKAPKNKWEIS
ncbi:MAG: TIGR00730 family Rossman fold protein [Arcobacter sp.]|nr:MAG: TIGR00730 family Rossman fold protein [Arcobacter sp.]